MVRRCKPTAAPTAVDRDATEHSCSSGLPSGPWRPVGRSAARVQTRFGNADPSSISELSVPRRSRCFRKPPRRMTSRLRRRLRRGPAGTPAGGPARPGAGPAPRRPVMQLATPPHQPHIGGRPRKHGGQLTLSDRRPGRPQRQATHGPSRTLSVARPWPRPLSVAVRGKPTATPTVRAAVRRPLYIRGHCDIVVYSDPR